MVSQLINALVPIREISIAIAPAKSRRVMRRNLRVVGVLVGDDAVVEFEDLVADRLGCLVALSGDQHNVTFAGAGDRVADGAATVDFDELRGCIHSGTIASMMASGLHLEGCRCDDDPVGESAGDLAHLGPLP